MVVMGVSNTTDSGACLVIDGVLVAAINEERLTQDKMSRAFPEKSIEWVLKSQGLKPDDIDAIGMGAWKGINSKEMLEAYLSKIKERINQSPDTARIIELRVQSSIERDNLQWTELKTGLERLGFGRHRLLQCSHQIAHAYTAFEYSNYEKALVVTLDGRGDFMSGSVTRWKKGFPPEVLRTELDIDSLGAFYGWITHYLGFTPHRHEGKITGLAAFGNPGKCIEIIKRMIKQEDGCIRSNIGKYYTPNMWADLPELSKELKECKPEDIAAAAQKLLEEIVVAYIRHYLHKTGECNLCVAGGIFANVLVNMYLRELPEVDNFFVYPHMGDGGIAAGGAAYAAITLGDTIKPIQNVYLGPSFDGEYCYNAVNNCGFETIRPEDFSNSVASLLYDGVVVGFFSGRMEYGPRALGGRSILVRATEPAINEKLNRYLNRTEFMPFAPVTLEEEAGSCYRGWSKKDSTSYYMTSCYKCTDLMKKQSPAAVHIDGTARPQIINEHINKDYYAVLRAYSSLSGIPSLINTSFNYHEDPIICNPEQAINMLKTDGINVLAMPPFILFKNGKLRKKI